MKKSTLTLIIFFFIYLSISLTTVHLLTDGIVGMRHDWVSPVYPDQINDHIEKELNTWSDANSFSYIRRNLLYFKFFQLVIGFSTGFDATLFSISTIFLLLTLSGISMFLLSKKLISSDICAFIAGLFYMLNPLVFNKIIAGHTGFMFSYMLAPFIIYFYLLSRKKTYTDWKYIVISGLFFGLAFSQHQFIVLIPSILLLIIVLNWIEKFTIDLKELFYLLIISLIGIGMHLFWIIPYIMYSGLEFSRLGPVTYHALTNAPSIWQSFLMIGWSQPYDYMRLVNDGLLDPIIFICLFIIIIFAFFSLILKNNMKKKITFVSLFLIGIFLNTGINNPGGEFFRFTYINLPFFRIFRDPYTFTFFITFSISLLLSFLLNDVFIEIHKRLQNYKKLVFYSLTIVIIFFILLSSYPMMNGNYSNQIQTFSFPNEYENLYDSISHENTLSRIFYFPSLQPINIIGNDYAGRDNMIVYPPKPSFPQNVNRLDHFNRLHMYTILNLRQGLNISNLLKITSTEYVVNRENYESWYYRYVPGNEGFWDKDLYQEVLNQFNQYYTSPNIDIFEVEYSPFIKIVNPIYSTGNFNIISSIPSNLLNKTSIIFHGNNPAEIKKSMNMSVITNEGQYSKEYEISSIDSTKIIRLKTEETNVKNGWVYDDNIWRLYPEIAADTFFNGFQTVVTTSNDAELNNSFSLSENADYRVFIRLYQNEDGGKLQLLIDNKKYTIETKNNYNSFFFKDLGVIPLDQGFHRLLLKNLEGTNAVSYVMMTPITEYNSFLQEYEQDISKTNLIYIFEPENDFSIKNPRNNYLYNVENNRVVDLELVRNIWKEIKIDRNDEYMMAIKGSGEFDFSIQNNNFEFNEENFTYKQYGPIQLDEQIYNLSFSSIKKTTLTSFSFEKDNDIWGKQTSFFEKEYDQESFEGSNSLKFTTSSERSPSWSWVRSKAINVSSESKYRIITHMKYENVKQSHIPIEVFNESLNSWQQINQIPSGTDGSSSEWKEYDRILEIPSNATQLRFVLNAGWVLDNESGDAITWFDDFRVYPINKGIIDKIWLYPSNSKKNITELFPYSNASQVQKYQKLSQTEYKVRINASEPYFLSFSEAYDTRWKAKIISDEIESTFDSIPLFNSINGFWIDKTGNYELIIQYEPQQYFNLGLLVSLFFMLGCVSFIFYSILKKYDYREIKRCLKERLQKR